MAWWISVSWPGIEPISVPCIGSQNLNQWTTREILYMAFFFPVTSFFFFFILGPWNESLQRKNNICDQIATYPWPTEGAWMVRWRLSSKSLDVAFLVEAEWFKRSSPRDTSLMSSGSWTITISASQPIFFIRMVSRFPHWSWCLKLHLCAPVLNWISETEFWVKHKKIAL